MKTWRESFTYMPQDTATGIALAVREVVVLGRLGWITMVVLHDLNLACQYADNLLVIANGAMKASGHPQSIVTPSLIAETYGVDVEVLRDRRGQLVIQPLVAVSL